MNREEIKRIEREQLVSIDNVIFEPIPKKDKERIKYMPPIEETPFFEDSWYADSKNKNQSEKDTIYLDKLGRTIERTCYFFVLLSFIGLLSALFFGKFL